MAILTTFSNFTGRHEMESVKGQSQDKKAGIALLIGS